MVAAGVGDTYSKHGRLALAIAENVTDSVGERIESALVQQRSHTDCCFEQQRASFQKDLQTEMDKRRGPTEDTSNMTADELILFRKNEYSDTQGKLLKAKLGKQKDDKLKKQQQKVQESKRNAKEKTLALQEKKAQLQQKTTMRKQNMIV